MIDAFCEHKIVRSEDGYPEDAIQCHRDAVGAYEIIWSGEVAAVMALCDEHREHLESMPQYDELRETKDYEPNTPLEGEQ